MSRWERIVRSSSEGRRVSAKIVAGLDEAVGYWFVSAGDVIFGI